MLFVGIGDSMEQQPLFNRIELVALNIVKVITEDGKKYILQELNGKLRPVEVKI